MGRRRVFIVLSFLLTTAFAPWGGGQVWAQSTAEVDTSNKAAVERLRERAERVQERRKARVTQAQREAAAERAKTAREKGASRKADSAKTPPDTGGKGGGQ